MIENYKVFKNFFTRDQCFAMARKMENLLTRGIYRQPDTQCRKSPAFYSIFNDEMKEILPKLEKAIDTELWPCYTYSRIYQEGDYLLPHFDRPEAEISFTLTLDYEKFIWPFWFQNDLGEFEEVLLDIGDILVYKGNDVSHFRHPMQGQDFQHQAFFHFVIKDGKYSHHKFDHRERLITSKEAEAWNYPEWTDEEFKSNKEHVLNRVAQENKL